MSTGTGNPSQPGTPSLLRAINDRAALELLLEQGPLSRTQLGQLTGLSKPTASQLLARLESAGLVVPVGTTAGRPGPGAQLYEINPRAAYVAGLDVSQERIRIAIADITGAVVTEHRLPLRSHVEPGDALAQVSTALDTATAAAGLERAQLRQVVIGTPGALDPATGLLRYAPHLVGWHSAHLVAELTAALGVPVALENDVNLAAMAEQRVGLARGVQDFVLLWVEAGIGAALVLGGRMHRGHTGGAGEIGYMPMPGAPLIKNVHLETENSGGFQELAGAPAVLALAAEHGLTGASAQDVVTEAVKSGAEAFLRTLAERMATGLAALVAVVDPELVVLSGQVPRAGGEVLRSLVQEELSGLAIPRPRLLVSELAGSPVVVGALQTALTSAREQVFSTH
ncbi:ROK family transcriptional regulator [Streptacidiphilus jiangxiensis]|uniref:Sugar kinase of the NBD/HSP70 family, may contain an N-terminal HTH domain n=1 Tax=Streptacidiphilus jiangxiensis TaxID=235985 RepID=A0A1H7S2I5_STRJI|nr:ROK family transcriptional regulator [Streptacidiphilus jiangxiensis]SEL66821.1 Sugar kinase of the NBD/HSP70 family, may contain an N-terminal HTH domain [Streptacidiphilus jiangxiensis]